MEQDISKLSEEELQALADEINGADQPRDDKGRFVRGPQHGGDLVAGLEATAEAQEAAGEGEEEAEQEEEAQPEPEKWFVREIDLGDGSGKQVFKGRSLDELADRLAEAQTHATRKIRELSQQKKRSAQEDADNEFVLQQELLNNPSKVLDREIERRIEAREQARQQKEKEARDAVEQEEKVANKAATDFVKAHPDYYPSSSNGERMKRYMSRMGWEWNLENIEKAYEELNADGLLAPVPEVPAESKAEQEPTRIAEPERKPVVQKRVAGSGLSAKRSAVVAKPKPAEPSIEDLYKMPLEELRERANSEARKSQDSGLAY